MKIVSTAPVRLDFNGGGTDVNPFAATFGGTVVNATINRGYRAVLTPRRDTLVEVIDKERRVFDLKIPLTYGEDVHFDLIRAILNYFRDKIVTGFTLIIHSDIEDSAGLGSSACFTVTVLCAMFQFLPKKPPYFPTRSFFFFFFNNFFSFFLKIIKGREFFLGVNTAR